MAKLEWGRTACPSLEYQVVKREFWLDQSDATHQIWGYASSQKRNQMRPERTSGEAPLSKVAFVAEAPDAVTPTSWSRAGVRGGG